MELNRANIEKRFARYVLPSILTQMLMGLYTVVDGLFIGRYAGDVGLSAVNLSWPVAAIVFAASGGIGTGGAVLIGNRFGQDKPEDVVRARGTTVVLLVLFGVFFTVAFSLLLPVLLTILGATGAVREAAHDYLQIIIWGSMLQMLSCGLGPVLRNFGRTVGVMAVSMASGLINVVLDWVFVGLLHRGASGAAEATMSAQAISVIFYLYCLFRNKEQPVRFSEFRLRKAESKAILSVGLSPFGLSAASSITLMFTNWQCIRYGGNDAVAAYAVAAYVTGAVGAFLSGLGEGIQPLVSFAEGASDHNAAKRVFHRAVRLSLMMSVVLSAVSVIFRVQLGELFGCGPAASEMLNTAMIFTPLGYPLMGLCKLCSSYLYAGGAHRYSSLLIYLEPLAVSPVMLLLVPLFLKVTGIWVSYPLTYVVLIVLAAVLIHLHEKKKAAAPRRIENN